MDIFEEIVRLRALGRPAALTTIVQCLGSSPQKEGAKMLVRSDGSIMGTLGGGCIEAEAIQAALMTLRDGVPQTVTFDLTDREGGLVCGGKVLVYIEPIVPDPHVVILGAGHVGKALCSAARICGFRVTVIDDRPEHANAENLPEAHEVIVCDYADVFSVVKSDVREFIVIATRGHNHDLEAVRAALGTEARFIGLLGSRRKKALLVRRLKDEGFSEDQVSRIVTPVGLPIGSVTPEEIAVSIAAQLIQVRRQGEPTGIGNTPCGRVVEEDGPAETAAPLRC